MKWEQLADIFNDGIREFIHWDGELLKTKAHQRTYCAKLACHLERCLWESVAPDNGMPPWTEYRVDAEYNRVHSTMTKRLRRPRLKNARKKPGKYRVYPDMIIHKRGPDGPNLLVAEVVNRPNRDDVEAVYNFWKLAAFVENLDYEFGLYLCFATGAENRGLVLEAWLLDGKDWGEPDQREREKNIGELSLLSDRLLLDSESSAAKEDFRSLRDALGFRKLDENLRAGSRMSLADNRLIDAVD